MDDKYTAESVTDAGDENAPEGPTSWKGELCRGELRREGVVDPDTAPTLLLPLLLATKKPVTAVCRRDGASERVGEGGISSDRAR